MRDIRKLLFITGVATVTPVIIQARDKLPNIVIFFMDDMGYGDLTVTGASGYTRQLLTDWPLKECFLPTFMQPNL